MEVIKNIGQIHFLKTVQPYFDLVGSKAKKFEVRFNDRNYCSKDILILAEFDAMNQRYSGIYSLVTVDYVLNDKDFCKRGFVIMSITLIDEQNIAIESLERLNEKLKSFNQLLKQQLCVPSQN